MTKSYVMLALLSTYIQLHADQYKIVGFRADNRSCWTQLKHAYRAQKYEKPTYDLFDGVRAGDIKKVEKALSNGALVNALCSFKSDDGKSLPARDWSGGGTALGIAAYKGDDLMVQTLLQKGAAPNRIGFLYDHSWPIALAINNKNLSDVKTCDVVRTLIGDNEGLYSGLQISNAFQSALGQGKNVTADYLFERHANGRLYFAAENGNYEGAVAALSDGAKADLARWFVSQISPLMAVERGAVSVLTKLSPLIAVERGAVAAMRGMDGDKKIGNAKIIDFYQIAGLLLDHGACERVDLRGHTELLPHIGLLKLLQKRGLEIDFTGYDNYAASTEIQTTPLESWDYEKHAHMFSGDVLESWEYEKHAHMFSGDVEAEDAPKIWRSTLPETA